MLSIIFDDYHNDIDYNLEYIKKDLFLTCLKIKVEKSDIVFEASPISCGITELDSIGDSHHAWLKLISDIVNDKKLKVSSKVIHDLAFLGLFKSFDIDHVLSKSAEESGLFMMSLPVKENPTSLLSKLNKLSNAVTTVRNPNSGNEITTYLFHCKDFCSTLQKELDTFLAKYKNY